MSNFTGKSVIVTGSSSGIGEATALMYVSRGANVTICGRNAERVQEVVGKCEKAGKDAGHKNKVVGVTGEITDAACRTETVAKTVEAFGGLDVLVANHGMAVQNRNLEQITEEMYNQSIDINVKATLFLIQEALPHLEKSKGNIVVTSSVGSSCPNVVGSPYFISKAAADHMVRCLAMELGPKGIRINTINPTAVRTRLTGLNSTESPLFKYVGASHPLHQRISNTDEQAEVILFLSSDAARFVTGESIKVDGGMSLKGNPIEFFLQNMRQ